MQHSSRILQRLTLALPLLALDGCSGVSGLSGFLWQSPEVDRLASPSQNVAYPAPVDGPTVVAVYQFSDRTGQRKPNDKVALLSSAVTQGAESLLIKSLQEFGDGRWFRVVERSNLDNLIKERQLIRQQREAFEGPNATPLKPLMFAGMIIEGSIVGYDSNSAQGGIGGRMLGIGAQIEYRTDVVTIVLRAVSVQSGEVLLSIPVTKTIISYVTSTNLLKFIDMGTKAVEAEAGIGSNEPVTFATKAAIDAGVAEMVLSGEKKGLWRFSPDQTGNSGGKSR